MNINTKSPNNNSDNSNSSSSFLRIRRQIDKYDGQTILCKNQPVYELESWLGAGASGNYYLY
jgi:hypothetical protein